MPPVYRYLLFLVTVCDIAHQVTSKVVCFCNPARLRGESALSRRSDRS
jgi:hypothetical protein